MFAVPLGRRIDLKQVLVTVQHGGLIAGGELAVLEHCCFGVSRCMMAVN